ncbi:MAG: hypothetical protein QW587_00415 [Candidatus Bathyarchaeia archaeon]
MSLLDLLPKVVGAVIILAIGWVAGHLLARAVAGVIRRGKIEEAFRKTIFGKTLERSGVTLATFFNLLVRWLVYLMALLGAVDIMGVKILGTFMNVVVQYLPSLIGGTLIFVIGLIAADFVGDVIAVVSKEAKIEYANIFVAGLRLLLYFVVAVVALTVMKIDVSILHIFANALAWGSAVGVSVGLGIALGWGFKDTIARNAERWIRATRTTAERVEEATELEALRERVRELEASLAEHKARLEAYEKLRKARVEELTAPVPDLDSRLVEIVGESGRVSSEYGGYEIEVLDTVAFPWSDVATILYSQGFDVWLSKKGDKPTLHGKPREE